MRLEGSDLENPPLRLPLELVDEGGDSIGGSLNPRFTLYSSGVRATDGNLLKQNYGLIDFFRSIPKKWISFRIYDLSN